MPAPESPDVAVITGDSREVLRSLSTDSFSACVTDPPYELALAKWDATGIAFDVDLWREVFRVLKPGAHLMAFGASRLYHRLAVAIEDAGFEIRDCFVWAYAPAMPHSQDVAKAIDVKVGGTPLQLGREWLHPVRNAIVSTEGKRPKRLHRITAPGSPEAQAWRGWSNGFRPAWEPIVVARKPLALPFAENVMEYGTGAVREQVTVGHRQSNIVATDPVLGRISPIFAVPKAKGARRGGAKHLSVKPVDLMVHLLTVVTPPGGAVLDPFGGSGSTGVAAKLAGFGATLIELSPEFAAGARERIDLTEPV